MASEIGIAPQFESSVEGAGGDHPSVPRDVAAGHLVVVPAVEEQMVFS